METHKSLQMISAGDCVDTCAAPIESTTPQIAGDSVGYMTYSSKCIINH